MDYNITRLIETALKVKDAFSNEEIRLLTTEDYVRAIVTADAINEPIKLITLLDGIETRLVPVDDKIEIRMYIE